MDQSQSSAAFGTQSEAAHQGHSGFGQRQSVHPGAAFGARGFGQTPSSPNPLGQSPGAGGVSPSR